MKSLARRRPSRPSRTPVVELLEARIAPATFFVTTATDNQPGSLRDVITQANNTPNVGGPDTISFANIGAGGPFIILLQSQLPTITESVIIDGYTAPGTQANNTNIGTNAVLRVMLDGSQMTGNGLVFGSDADSDAGGSVVKGLAIAGFHPGVNESGFGILIQASNVTVAGNFIGTDLTGTQIYSGTDSGGTPISGNGNAAVGVFKLSGVENFTNVLIGGPSPADRNILSGSAYGAILDSHASLSTVQGNLIGTDKTGNTAIPNTNTGVTVIGSSNSVVGNVVSGNSGVGIGIGTGSGTSVTGNIVGLNAAGDTVLGNGNTGIRIDNNASGVSIGGNAISGNSGAGIDVGSPFGDGAGDNVIIQGNKIGTDLAGSISVDFGNAKGGIAVYSTSSATIGGTSIGDSNVIAWNDGPGVFITNPTAGGSNQGVLISGNSIHNNAGLGIDLKSSSENFYGVNANDNFDTDNGVNHLLNFPVITANSNNGTDLTLTAAVHAEPNRQYRVEFFVMAPTQVNASGYGEGTVYLGSVTVTTNNSGDAQAVYNGSPGVPVDSYYSTTLIDATTNDTSEFSLAAGPGPITFTWTGSTSSDWFNPSNWAPNGVPGANDIAIYSGGGINSLSLIGSAAVSSFIQNGGVFGGTGSLTVRDNFLWTAGSHNGPSLALAGDATLSGSTPLQWLNGDLKVAGNFAITDSILRFNQGIFTVDATGVVSLSNGIVDGDGSATTSQFFNHGQIIKNGAGTFGVVLGSGQNDGLIDIKQGTFQVGSFELTGGKIFLDGGNLSTGAQTILLSDGTITGTGAITGTVNNQFGYLSPGGEYAAGTITITGTYTQGGGGTYLFDLGGPNAGAGYDQLVVNGTANLGGVLNVTYLPGFAPAPGSTFTEVTATSINGIFQFVVGEGLLTASYTATAALLTRNGNIIHWDGGGGDTNWDTAANWEFDTVPGTNDVAILDINATITLSAGNRTVGDFVQSMGTLTGSSNLNVLGSLQWTGGTQSGSGQTITDFSSSSIIKGTSTKILDGRTLFLNGTLDWSDTGLLSLTNNATIEDHNIFQISGDVAFDTTSPSGSIFIANEGTLRKTSTGTLAFVSGLTFEMDGLFDLQFGTVQVLGGGGANAGTFLVSNSASLELTPSVSFDVTDFVTLTGDGVITLNGTLNINTESILELTHGTTLFFQSGSLNFNSSDAYMTVDGFMVWSGGDIIGGVHLRVEGELDIDGTGPKNLSGGTLSYQTGSTGAISGSGPVGLNGGAVLEIGGDVHITTAVDLVGGGGPLGQLHVLSGGRLTRDGDTSTTTISAPVTNAGEIFVTTGSTLTFSNSYVQTGGVLFVGSTSSITTTTSLQIQSGTVSGYGTIVGDVNNLSGTVAPGGDPETIGTLTITGTYSQGSAGSVVLEASSAANYDVLAVSGAAVFDGTFSFVPVGGYTPGAVASFPVLTHGTAVGNFATADIPNGSALNYNAGNVSVDFGSAPPLNPFEVTTTDDTVDALDNVTSLREAILAANATAGTDTITFNIAGSGLQMISLSSALPDITESVIINGYSQFGSSVNTLALGSDAVFKIEIIGDNTIAAGLTVDAADVTIIGLVIAGFDNGTDSAGIILTSNASNAVIKGNLIGEDPSEGIAANFYGIRVTGATNVTIGGTTPADRNDISGNTNIGLYIDSAVNITVQGNYIGIDSTGTAALGNSDGIYLTGSSGTIGGTAAGAGNVISGNLGNGITIDTGTTGLLVQGNYIGTNAAGTAAVGNTDHGIEIRDAVGNTIGGSSAGAGNVISGNLLHGVYINGSATGTNFVQGNLIGTAADGTMIVGNVGAGVYVAKSNNVIGGTGAGEGNVIAGNGANGVSVVGATGVQILGNSISGNTGVGIDLGDDGSTANDATDSDSGDNNLLNFPVLTSASLGGTTVDINGTVTTDITGTVRVEFFKTDASGTQGKTYLGFINVAVVAGNAASFSASLSSLGLSDGDKIVATTTDSTSISAGTSEFSANVTAVAPVTVNIGSASVVEGTGGTKQMVFTVTLSATVGATVTVDFTTADFSMDARNATAGVDYTSLSGTVIFSPGQLTQTLSIDITTDSVAEARERFVVNLSNPTNAALGTSQVGVGAINDDDHHTFAVGEGSGNSVSVYTTSPTGATLVQTIDVFPAKYKGGVRVAVGDVNGDGIDDIIAGGGSGSKAVVRVYDGSTLLPLGGVLGGFSAYGLSYRGGVFVASADVNGDGFDDVIVTPSAGSSNQVRIFSGADGTLLNSFRAFGAGSGGVRVATGDVNGDGFDDIVVGTGVGSAVRVFDAMTGTLISGAVNKANVFAKSYRGGVYVAAGDVDGDGRDDVMVSAGTGTPNVQIYPHGVSTPETVKAYNSGKLKGARISALDINGDGIADIIATKGRGGENRLSAFSGSSTHTSLFNLEPLSLQTDGVYVG